MPTAYITSLMTTLLTMPSMQQGMVDGRNMLRHGPSSVSGAQENCMPCGVFLENYLAALCMPVQLEQRSSPSSRSMATPIEHLQPQRMPCGPRDLPWHESLFCLLSPKSSCMSKPHTSCRTCRGLPGSPAAPAAPARHHSQLQRPQRRGVWRGTSPHASRMLCCPRWDPWPPGATTSSRRPQSPLVRALLLRPNTAQTHITAVM